MQNPSIHRFRHSLLLAAVTASLFVSQAAHAAGAAAADPDQVAVTPAQMQQLGIATRTLGKGGVELQANLPAVVAVPTAQLRIVAAPLAGVIEALMVAPGEVVKAGQPIARLTSPQALELRRDILQARSQADLASKAEKRDEQLFKEGLIPESRREGSRAAAAQARAAAAERSQALAMAGSGSGASVVLKSPITGTVLQQGATLGQRVEQSAVLYQVGKLSPLWLEIQVPADVAARLKPGLAVRAAGASGQLISVGGAVESTSQMVTVRAAMTKGVERLRPGQALSAEMDLPETGMSVPVAALARDGQRTVVFVQSGAGFKATPVKVGNGAGDTVAVEGLAPGSTVAVTGVSGLKAIWTGVGGE